MENKSLYFLTDNSKEAIKERLWNVMENDASECRRCPLSAHRNKVVLGEGNKSTKLMLIGEGPGADEDTSGHPFVGKAGKLLTQILESVSISRDDLYITNIVKCRPPENRVPELDEVVACSNLLETQITLINPSLIVLLGNASLKAILKTNEGITRLRGKWFDWNGIAVMPMFHPSYLLRNSSAKEGSPKHLTWIDIQEIKRQWVSIKKSGKKTEDFRYG